LDEGVRAALDAIPEDIRASFRQTVEMIGSYGLERMREPYVRHLQRPVWKMRMRGDDGMRRSRESWFEMTRKFLPVEESFREWETDPAFMAAYDALEDEFALARALIEARSRADMTQEQVAAAMGTTQAVIARLESGRTMPSTRTLARFAKATGMRLRISFEPEKPKADYA
jgi:DNA-binding XRE family transcriptional regulator